MLKKFLAFLMILALLSCTVSAFADGEWICPECHEEMKADYLYCYKDQTRNPELWDCSNCGRENNREEFCPKCATPKGGVTPSPSPDPNLWDCTNCNATNNLGNFCSNCAAPKGGITPSPSPSPTPTPKPVPILQSDFYTQQTGDTIGDMPVFGNKNYLRKDITRIVFKQTVPANQNGTWDVSISKNGSVWAWVDSSNVLYIASNTGDVIRMPESCERLFEGYTNATSI